MEADFFLTLVKTFGFPITVAVVVSVAFWKVLTRLLDNHQKLITELQEQSKQETSLFDARLAEQQKLLANHITHLDASIKQQSNDLSSTEKAVDRMGSRIVDAIKSQTEIVKELLGRGCPLRHSDEENGR